MGTAVLVRQSDDTNQILTFTCGRCGGELKHTLTLQKSVGEYPTYEIFTCLGCGGVQWVKQE
jgi:DNA-directed RNA polymerase subunit M/transcription elongation factor TFIIS